VRIERHQAGDRKLAVAEADFGDRVDAELRSLRHDPTPGYTWTAIAEVLLDYLGARSVHNPALTGRDAQVAFESAASAAVGAMRLAQFPRDRFDIFLDYVNTGMVYDEADDDEGAWPLDEHGWLKTFYLAFLANTSDDHDEAFIKAAPPWRGNEERAGVALVHALMAYVFGHTEGRTPGPESDAEKCAVIDGIIDRLPAGDSSAGGYLAHLHTVRALAADDQETFTRGLVAQLEHHREVCSQGSGDPEPHTLLPLPAIAFAAMAWRRNAWTVEVDSDYLPSALIAAFWTGPPRVRAYGRDKRADARAAIAAGPLVIERPTHPHTAPGDPSAVLTRFNDPDAEPARVATDLTRVMSRMGSAFLAGAATDPDGADARLHATLLAGAEAGAAVFRLARAEQGTQVEVTLGETTRLLPALRDRYTKPPEWGAATAMALVVGVRELLADCVLVDPDFFMRKRIGGSYFSALHDYLRGEDPKPALDEALRRAAQTPRSPVLRPPLVLLSQLVQGDREGFVLALADALEEHREHYSVGDRANDLEAGVNLNILGLTCHARRLGWPVPVRSPYLPQGLLP
jgi:hypothetical protein